MVLSPTLFPGSREAAGPKHSTSVPSSTGSAVALSADVKGPLDPGPKPLSDIAVKRRLAPLGIQVLTGSFTPCDKVHRLLLLPTLQRVVPLPLTVHLKVIVPPGQVGGAAVNCPETPPVYIKKKSTVTLCDPNLSPVCRNQTM